MSWLADGVGRKISSVIKLRRGAAIVFALTAVVPLLVALYSLGQTGAIQQPTVQLHLGLALGLAILGYVTLQLMVKRISDIAGALNFQKPVGDVEQWSADVTTVPGLGKVSELGDFANVLQRLLSDLKASTDRLEDMVFKLGLLNETVEIAAKIPNINDLLGHVLERMMRAVGANVGSVMLLERDRRVLKITVARGLPQDVVDATEVPVGQGIAGKVVELGEPVIVEDIETDQRFAKADDPKYGSRSFIALPLKVAGARIIGVVNLAKKESRGGEAPFSTADLHFLNALVTHIAYAVDNARLLEEAQRSAERLREVVQDQKVRLTVAQEQMVQSAKLSALGQLVAGVAHELNNPLSVLLGYSELMKHSAEGRMRQNLEIMQDAAERARTIVHGLQTFARRVPLERRPLDLVELVQGVIRMVANDLRLADVTVECEADGDLPAVPADRHPLQQVLINLVTNAKHAMADSPRERRLRVAVRRGSAGRVLIEVGDSGTGIPPEILPTIFDPFVSTKGTDGTGLGLSISYGIIQEHGGAIRVESQVGVGTTFTIDLPVGAASAEATEAATRALDLVGKRVMVVEDDPLIVELIESHLQPTGVTVAAHADAEAALAHIDSSYALVLVDLYLPRMKGADFIRAALARHPELDRRFLCITASTVPDVLRQSLQELSADILEKPFSGSQLLQAIADVLDGTSAAREGALVHASPARAGKVTEVL